MNKISIVLPCYNHGEYVKDAIESVLQQTYSNFELFVFDNGSTDNSWEIISKIEDHRMKKIKLKKNDLLEVKRQFINMATGEFFAVMHSDDLWKKEKLEKQMEFLHKNKSAHLCFTWSIVVDKQLNPIDKFDGLFIECNKSEQEWWNTFFERGNHLSCPSFLCEKEIYVKYFGKLYPYRQIADFYCWMKILEETNLYIVEEVLVNQRYHDYGSNKNESAHVFENNVRCAVEFEYVLYKIIDEIEDSLFLKYFCDNNTNNYELNHIDVMCRKFLFFVNRGKKSVREFNNVIRYYNAYFDYEENGNIFYQYLSDRYEFSRNDFFEFEGREGSYINKIQSRLRRWKELENADFSVLEYPDSVSIYGCGDIGKAFAKRIRKYCHIEQFIDSFPQIDEYEGIPIVGLDKAKIDSKSVIVIIPTYDYEKITENIKNFYCFIHDNQMISIEKFIKLKKDEGESRGHIKV